MAKVQGTYKRRVMSIGNGDGTPPGVPDDIEWTDDAPVVLFPCSQNTSHNPHCDGNCGDPLVATHALVNLINESHAWSRARMSFHGLPSSLRGGPFPGVDVEILDVESLGLVLREIIIDKLGVSEEEIDEMFQVQKYEKLSMIRESVEAPLREQRLKQQLGLGQKPGLLGPDGRPLG